MKRIKNQKEKQFNVRVTKDQLEELRRHAWDTNISISTIVRDTLESRGIITSTRIKKH